MRRLRIYIDTSVLGAIFDEEFKEATALFFEQSHDSFDIILSTLLEDEIADAPQNIRDFYNKILEYSEIVTPTRQAILLQQAYLNVGVVSSKWASDALHVALATVTECDMIVSWNFKHIVHYDKKRKYNAVNILYGYKNVEILTPAEVIKYEEDL